MKALLIVAAVVLLGGTARGDESDSPAGVAFRDATRLIADGDLEAAQHAFEAVAAMEPAGPWADDALSEAATVAERRGDLGSALRLWRRVLDEHPSSRQARRARTKLTALESAVGDGGRWLEVAVEHERILRAAVGQSDPSDQVRALEALLEANPEYPRAHDARMWIGDGWMRLGFAGRAAEIFAGARDRTSDPEQRWRATKALGDAQKVSGDLDAAEATYRSLLGAGDEIADRSIREELERVDLLRLRKQLELAAWIALGVGLVVVLFCLWRSTRGPAAMVDALIRPPVEVMFFVPVAIVLYVVAATGNLLVLHAVRTILFGGLVVTWLVGASLEAARRAGRLRLGFVAPHLIVAVVAVLSILYLAIMQDQLPEMIAETMTHGHDR